MNLNFPSRFLKKLDIYQQIRTGQGISKHKHLWKYEAAFLQTAYGKGHQHLSNPVSRSSFKKWIEETTPFNPKKDEEELNHIIANLFWRGHIDAFKRVNEKRDEQAKEEASNGLELFDRNKFAFKSSAFGDENNLDYRPTLEGLFVGEVLSEINNKNSLLRVWNNYKYNFILDFFWLVIFWGILNFIAPEVLTFLGEWSIRLCSIEIGVPWTTLVFVFVIGPIASFVMRKVLN